MRRGFRPREDLRRNRPAGRRRAPLSGLRTTEFCRLTFADTVVGRGESVFVVTGLAGRDRTVYVPLRISELVNQFVRGVRTRLLPAHVDPSDLTQPLVLGERKNPPGKDRALSSRRAGAHRRGPRRSASVQLLRHTYGYMAYAGSHGNLLFVQRQLGHAHPMVTAIYAQFIDESYQAMAETVYDGVGVLTPRRKLVRRKDGKTSITKREQR